MTGGRVDFDRVAEAALRDAELIVRRWLPGGRTEGAEWVARNPRRLDRRRGSFKVNLRTGELTRLYEGSVPGNGAVLATAGDLIFWGDMDRRFRAFDAETGDVLWETVLGGVIQMSTITYAVDGKQYVAVMTGDGNSATRNPVRLAGLTVPRGHNAIFVFALP